jgi:hypothetical protein
MLHKIKDHCIIMSKLYYMVLRDMYDYLRKWKNVERLSMNIR